MKDETKNKSKRPYQPPRLRVVDLAADEVLATGCKSGGGGSNSGLSPCPVGRCARPGSS